VFFPLLARAARTSPLLDSFVPSPSRGRFTGGKCSVVPSEDYSHAPPGLRSLDFVKGDRPKTNSRAQKKTMKTNTNNSELKSRSEQLSTPKQGLARINFRRRYVNRTLDTETLLSVLHGSAPQFFELAEVVGKWVWIQFSEQPGVEIRQRLAELGFHWNNARQVWQHPCGLYRDKAANFDPRKVYGCYFAADFIRACNTHSA
jgi:hypothetical protein